MIHRWFLAFATLLSPAAFAGWVSIGSGELFRDEHNPLFLKNISQVNYCVMIAANTVSASEQTVRGSVRTALDYWINEFRKARQGFGQGQFDVATQNFVEVDCTATDVRLIFKVGYETLSADDIANLKNPVDYIGVAARTDYDSELRGKGLIFIASDIGTNSYHGGTDPNLITLAWRRPRLLTYALMHELGHVFGLPHTGSGLMSETFLEQILNVNLADIFDKAPVESFFAPDDELDMCGILATTPLAFTWLEAPAGHDCIHLTRTGMGNHWKVFSRKDKATPLTDPTFLGTIMAGVAELGDFRTRPAIVLQLMGNTSVFTPEETKFRPFMFGPMFVDIGMTGNFVPANGSASRPVYVRITPESLLVQGIYSGKIANVISYFSPIGLLLLRDPVPGPHRGGGIE